MIRAPLLMMLVLAVASSRACNSDTSDDNTTTLSLTQCHLQEVRNFSLQNLRTLDLSLNLITYLDDSSFSQLQSLRSLNLSGNSISNVSEWISNLKELHTLDLSSNRISFMYNGVFIPLTELRWLNISENELTVLNKSWLTGLDKLETFDLSSNSIFLIEDDALSQLANILRLDLHENEMVKLKQQWFSGLQKLQNLDISHNAISEIENCTLTPLTGLQFLNLSHNKLETVSEETFQMLGNLQTLDLSYNNISVLNDGTFSSLITLQRLNIRRNRLQILGENCFSGLGHLQRLDVSGNAVHGVSPGTFQPLVGLTELMLGDNPALGQLRPDQLMLALGGTGRRLLLVDASRAGLTHVPAALTRSVSTLRLSGNAVVAVRCGDLDSYPLLRSLDLANNLLADVEEDALGRLEALEILHLDGNLLSTVPRSLPASLRMLNLERNKISIVRVGDFQGLPHLIELFLRDCGITAIEKGSFGPLLALESLDLSRNPLVSLSAASLSGPNRLRILRLSQLAKIQGGGEGEMAFPARAPERLEVLELDASPVLARQLLADTAALVAFRQLRVLNLEAAGLTTLRSDLFHFLPHLSALRLAENPWECGQADDILWLAEWMQQQTGDAHDILQHAICAQPQRFRGTAIINLHHVDFSSTRYENCTSTISPTASQPTPKPTMKTNITEKHPIPLRKSSIIHIISSNKSSYNSTKESISKRLTQKNARPVTNIIQPVDASSNANHRLLLNITVLKSGTPKAAAILTSSSIEATTEMLPTSNQSLDETMATTLNKQTSDLDTTITSPMSDYISTTISYPEIIDDPHQQATTTLPVEPLVPKLLLSTPQPKKMGYNNIPIHILQKTSSSNESQGKQRPFDSIMRDEYTPNPEITNDKSTRIDPALDSITPGQKSFRKSTEQNKHVKSSNNIIQDVRSFINETKTRLTLDHEVREKLTTNTKKSINDILLDKSSHSKMFHNNDEFPLSTPGISETDTSLSTHTQSNTTDPWAGENFVFENVTLVSRGESNINESSKTVFYSSRANDPFSSSVRVTVQDASSAAGSPSSYHGSHPGMFVLLAVGVGVVAALAMALSHCAKRRRRLAVEYSRQQDIEVRSMSSIGDLW